MQRRGASSLRCFALQFCPLGCCLSVVSPQIALASLQSEYQFLGSATEELRGIKRAKDKRSKTPPASRRAQINQSNLRSPRRSATQQPAPRPLPQHRPRPPFACPRRTCQRQNRHVQRYQRGTPRRRTSKLGYVVSVRPAFPMVRTSEQTRPAIPKSPTRARPWSMGRCFLFAHPRS